MAWPSTCLSCILAVVVVIVALEMQSLHFTHERVHLLPVYDLAAETLRSTSVTFPPTQSMQQQYAIEGLVIVRNLLPPQWVSIALNVSKKVYQLRSAADALPTKNVTALYSNWPENAVIRKLWFESGISQFVAETVQSNSMRLFEDLVIMTEPGRMDFGCWHSDWYSFADVAEKELGFSVWIPLVDIPSSLGGSVQYCHRNHVPDNCSDIAYGCEKIARGEPYGRCEAAAAIACPTPEFRAGDAVIFAADAIHRSQLLKDPSFRRFSLVARFVDSRATYLPRRTSFLNSHTYKIRHDMCRHKLRAGDAFRGPCFPLVYPEAHAGDVNSERLYIRPALVAAMAKIDLWRYGGNVD